MEKKKSIQLYADMCNIIDHALGEVSGHTVAPDVQSTSPQARACAKKLVELLRKYGLDVGGLR